MNASKQVFKELWPHCCVAIPFFTHLSKVFAESGSVIVNCVTREIAIPSKVSNIRLQKR